mgnify:CR=1 FL=1
MDKVRDKIKSITKEHGFRKCICYLLAFLIVFSLIWLFCSQQGFLARRSFKKTVGQDTNEPRVVRIYSGNALIETYVGHYTVEAYQNRLVIINRDNGETVDVWGNTSVIIDTAEDE